MTIENWFELAGFILTLTHLIGGWIVKLLLNKLKELSDMIANVQKQVIDNATYADRTYTTKEDIKQVQDNLISFLRRIEDRVNYIVDKK